MFLSIYLPTCYTTSYTACALSGLLLKTENYSVYLFTYYTTYYTT